MAAGVNFFTALPATSAAAALALAAALCLACGSLHGTLAAGTRRRLSHAVSRLQVLHHRAHGSARTSAARAGKFGHYTIRLDLTAATRLGLAARLGLATPLGLSLSRLFPTPKLVPWWFLVKEKLVIKLFRSLFP